ncbi:hypothetical protein [Ekhidna sp.]|uniref:hypothetical protein n=1 Tax=Ekhidna sp. TaxID=2608089 RepID=UPI00329A6131
MDSKIYYNLERELKNALITPNKEGETILEKKILRAVINGTINNCSIYQEFEIDETRADILAICEVEYYRKKSIEIHIIELKRGDINMEAVGQVMNYKSQVEKYLERDEILNHVSSSIPSKIVGHLIGSETSCFDDEYFSIMERLINTNQELFVHQYNFNPHSGLEFESYGRCIAGETKASSCMREVFENLGKRLIKEI